MVSDKLAKAAGPFSPAVRAGGFIHVSGQIGQDSATGKLVGGNVERQTEQAFANLVAVLDAAGKGLADVVRVGVYLTDMGDFAAMNGVYAKHFAEPYPARTTVGVAALPPRGRGGDRRHGEGLTAARWTAPTASSSRCPTGTMPRA